MLLLTTLWITLCGLSYNIYAIYTVFKSAMYINVETHDKLIGHIVSSIICFITALLVYAQLVAKYFESN